MALRLRGEHPRPSRDAPIGPVREAEEERRHRQRREKDKRKKKKRERERRGTRRHSSLHTESDEDIAPAQRVDIVTEEMPGGQLLTPPLGPWSVLPLVRCEHPLHFCSNCLIHRSR